MYKQRKGNLSFRASINHCPQVSISLLAVALGRSTNHLRWAHGAFPSSRALYRWSDKHMELSSTLQPLVRSSFPMLSLESLYEHVCNVQPTRILGGQWWNLYSGLLYCNHAYISVVFFALCTRNNRVLITAHITACTHPSLPNDK